jgi:dipeptidyl aminopeptidase/acylaminoacyl peptidase
MPPRKVKIEDLRRFVFVSDPQVSPDGGRVAFVHSTIDYPNDGYVKHIWVWERGSGEAAQFTHGPGSDSNPRWSPDGSQLLFVSSKRQPEKKSPQLWVIPSFGGEARLVADIEDAGVSNPAWAPDSRRILFTARVWEGEKPESDVRIVSRLNFRLNGVGLYPGKRVHLFTVRVSGKPKQLTKGEFDVNSAAWSPDGKSIGLITNTAEDADTSFIRDIYAMPAKGGEWSRLTRGKHLISDLSWSPNGEEIAYLGHDLHASTATNTNVWVMPAGGGDPVNLTASLDRSLGRGVGSDLRVSTPDPGAVWSPEGDSLYFLAGTVPTSNVYKVDRQTAEVEQLTEGRNVEGFSLSADESVMTYNSMDATHPAEIWVRDEGGERRVTKFNDGLLRRLSLSAPEHYTFRNGQEVEVDAWVMRPPDFQAGKRCPTVLQIHGGPMSIYGDGIYHEFQVLAANGYNVIYTNPRGSGGYGEDYAAVLQGQFGTVDYEDIMAFVDDALGRFDFIDPERLGVTGGSYGGYLTNWIVTQTDRFRAAVSCRSTCNRLSHHGYSDMGYRHGESGNMGYPWRDEEKLMRQSPIRYAANVKTPTLLIHSENDLRCPMGQAEEFFVALKELGVDTELVRFPDENHELSRSGKPKHREERLRHMLRWFDRYLK